MFKIGDYAVCPGHGVAQLCNIEDREVGSEKTSFYIFKLVSNGMTVMVPTASEDGIRGLVGEGEISDVYNLLNNHDVDVDNSTWNRRYREYMLKVKTGSLTEIAEVLRSLFLLKTRKNLSFGEKKMLDSCRELLVQEISLSKGEDKLEVKKKINSYFN